MAIYHKPLFEEDFQAWVHGPVIPELYYKYKKYQWKPIIEYVEDLSLPTDVLDFLEEVSDIYFVCDAYELEKMTHSEDPWLEARRDLPPDVPSNAIIPKDSMEKYYSARVEQEEAA